MKYIGVIILFLNLSLLQAQDFSKVDRYAKRTPKSVEQNIKSLTDYLVQNKTTDLDKVRSFYTWLIHHITYDDQIYKKGVKRLDQTTTTILKKKKAVCWGYAQVFKEMCNLVNIPCETVIGFSKNLPNGHIDWETENHAWNVVQLNKKWYVLDITWASGTLTNVDYWMNAYNEDYFLAPPKLFVLNHLPLDPMWQLLSAPITAEEFKKPLSQLEQLAQREGQNFNYQDSLKYYFHLPKEERGLKRAMNHYHYFPNLVNAREITHGFLEKIYTLDKKATQFEQQGNYDSLQIIQSQMLYYYQKATIYAPLYNNEKENWARTLLNYSVGQIRQIEANPPKEKMVITQVYKDAIQRLEKAEQVFKTLPSNNLFTLQALEQCQQLLEFARHNLTLYKQ